MIFYKVLSLTDYDYGSDSSDWGSIEDLDEVSSTTSDFSTPLPGTLDCIPVLFSDLLEDLMFAFESIVKTTASEADFKSVLQSAIPAVESLTQSFVENHLVDNTQNTLSPAAIKEKCEEHLATFETIFFNLFDEMLGSILNRDENRSISGHQYEKLRGYLDTVSSLTAYRFTNLLVTQFEDTTHVDDAVSDLSTLFQEAMFSVSESNPDHMYATYRASAQSVKLADVALPNGQIEGLVSQAGQTMYDIGFGFRGKQRPPGPPKNLFTGYLFWKFIVRNDLVTLLHALHNKYGEYVSFPIGHKTVVSLANPESAKRVARNPNVERGATLGQLEGVFGKDSILTTQKPDVWKHKHEILASVLMRSTANYERIQEIIDPILMAPLAKLAESGEPFNLHEFFKDVTIKIFCGVFLEIDKITESRKIGMLFSSLLQMMFDNTMTPLQKKDISVERAALWDEFTTIVQDNPGCINTQFIKNLLKLEGEITLDDLPKLLPMLREELLIMMFAGHETTAKLMTWVTHLLAAHPEIETEVLKEITDAGRAAFTHSGLRSLHLLNATLMEALRLFPPAYAFVRQANHPIEITPDYRAHPNDMVIFFTHRINRSGIFKDGDQFRPYRFLKDEDPRKALDFKKTMQVMSFAEGPQRCIGKYFALLEAMSILTSMLRKYKINSEGVPPAVFGVTTAPKDALVTVERRVPDPMEIDANSPLRGTFEEETTSRLGRARFAL
jgi:enediyne biosynthesis protein E7